MLLLLMLQCVRYVHIMQRPTLEKLRRGDDRILRINPEGSHQLEHRSDNHWIQSVSYASSPLPCQLACAGVGS